jgi:SAM-dependent methyltransferase
LNEIAATSDQHNLEIHENRAAWARKPVLRAAYADFYAEITKRVDRGIPGRIVELGSGMGNIKEHLPDCVTTDIFENPWLDQRENAYALSFADASLSHLILFDVWHHLEFPGAALDEARRCLAPGGRVILFEPDMGLLPRFVYDRFHHEPIALDEPIVWRPAAGFSAESAPYFAAQSRAYRIFVRGEQRENLSQWRVREVARFSAFSYLASGGFRGPQLLPLPLYPIARQVDRAFSHMPSLFSARLLVTLERL